VVIYFVLVLILAMINIVLVFGRFNVLFLKYFVSTSATEIQTRCYSRIPLISTKLTRLFDTKIQQASCYSIIQLVVAQVFKSVVAIRIQLITTK
jgi:hypothetical protein